MGGVTVSKIGQGVVILFGVGSEDNDPYLVEDHLHYLADKIANLRIFEDEAGKMNRSLLEVGGQAIVVSQLTLYADTRKGRRPSFTNAAAPDMAQPIIDRFVRLLQDQGVPTQTGQFGAHMLVEIANDGPVTIWIEK